MADDINIDIIQDGNITLTLSTSVTSFLNLSDTPSSYSGKASQIVSVNSSEDGLEFSDALGDMTKTVYDPDNIEDDAFDMDNMKESSTSKIFSDTERTKLSGIEDGAEVNTVDSVFGRTGDVVSEPNDYTWDQIDKTTSDIADIATKSHTSLTDVGTNTHAQIDSHISNTSDPHNVTKDQVGLSNVDNIQQLPLSYLDTDTTLSANSDTRVPSQKAIKTYADLLVNSTIRLQANWDANTNTPDITGTTTTGFAWRVSVSGSTDLGGITSWVVGDLAVKTDTGWLKIDNQDIAAIWGNISGPLSNQTDLQAALDLKFAKVDGDRMMSTSLINLDGNITIFSSTQVTIPAGRGQVVDNSDPDNPIVTPVEWVSFEHTITNIATQLVTWLSIDINGDIVETPTRPKGSELRSAFVIGVAEHINLTSVQQVYTITKTPSNNIALAISDLSSAIGNIEIKQEEVVVKPNGNNLSIDVTEGKFYTLGENFQTSKSSPNIIEYAGSTLATFFHDWRDGSGGFNNSGPITVINPSRYDDGTGGVGQPNGIVGPLEFQNFLIQLSPTSGNIVLVHGQKKYNSIIGALLGRESEFNEAIINPLVKLESFVGYITVRGDATDLSDSTQAQISRGQKVDNFYDAVTSLGDGLIYNKETDIIETANGVTTTVELQNKGGGDVIVQLDGQSFTLSDDGVDNVVSLIHGTDEVPALNYVYAVISGSKSILQVSTTEPTIGGVGLFANIKKYLVGSATFTQSDGFYLSQQTIDRFGSDKQSHIRHLNDIARETAKWISGVDQTATLTTQGGVVDDLFVALSSGIIRQLHPHTFSAFSNGDDIYVANDEVTAYEKITNLNEIDTDINGTTLRSNNDRYILVIWGAQDEDGSDRKVYINKPNGKYINDADAIADLDNTAQRGIPLDFQGTGFLIAQIIVHYTTINSGTLRIVQKNGADFEDLRTFVGGGVGGSVVAQTSFSDADFEIYNTTDPTKKITYSLTGLSSSSTRILTPQDKNYVLGDQADIDLNTTHRTSDGTDHSDVVLNNAHRINTSNPHSTTANQTGAVALTGNETISGVKTFNSFPVTPSTAPTTDYQTANKKYVDDNAGGGDLWSDPLDSNILPNTNNVYDIGALNNAIKSIYIGDRIGHRLQLDTYIDFSASVDLIQIYAGGSRVFRCSGTTFKSVDFNIDEHDVNVSMNGQGVSNVFFLDAENSKIGLKTNVPNELLDIRGRIYIEDDTVPTSTANRLYSLSGALHWNGVNLATGSWVGTATSDLDMNDNHIIKIKTAGCDNVLGGGSKTSSFDVNFDTSQSESVTLTANTMTATLKTPLQNDTTRTLYITNGGLATLIWASASGVIKWAGGTAPTLTTSGEDIVVFKWNGTNWYGVVSLDFS